MAAIPNETFRHQLGFLLHETFFPQVHPGPTAYLDRDAGWFPTLASVSAERASRATVAGGTTVAGHVDHTRFYLEVVRAFARGERPSVDWDASWRTTTVDEAAWTALQVAFRDAAEALTAEVERRTEWEQDALAGAMGALAHCAYHLGAIRQMLLVQG